MFSTPNPFQDQNQCQAEDNFQQHFQLNSSQPTWNCLLFLLMQSLLCYVNKDPRDNYATSKPSTKGIYNRLTHVTNPDSYLSIISLPCQNLQGVSYLLEWNNTSVHGDLHTQPILFKIKYVLCNYHFVMLRKIHELSIVGFWEI